MGTEKGVKVFNSIDFDDLEEEDEGLSELELNAVKGAILLENVSTGDELRDWAISHFGVAYREMFSLVSELSGHLVDYNGDLVLIVGEWIDPRQSFEQNNIRSACTILTRAWVGVLGSDKGLEVQRYIAGDEEMFKKGQRPAYRLMIRMPYKNNASIRVDKEEDISTDASTDHLDISRQRMVLLKPEQFVNLRRQDDIYLAVNAGDLGSSSEALKSSKTPLALKIIPGREMVLPRLYELTGKSAVLDVEPDCDELYRALTN